nr:single-stranded-DNA-specific exonuclease RecJ [Thermoleophilaceae bacterium]
MTPLAWNTSPYDYGASLRLQDELRLGPAAAAILVRRGHTDPADAREFLAAAVRTSATDLPGAGPACELVLGHVQKGSRILVFGDYDVDGVCSTAMMIRTLRALGADPVWQLPSRAEGYGLTSEAVERIAAYGTQLLVTVDCGVTSVEEVARAKELEMEVLVTDHHRPGPVLPDCPIVHPALGPDGQEAPAGELCAAGVVLKLSEALLAHAGQDPAQAEEDLDLAGLATVCDMVALRGENRRIAREGMAAIARTRKPGLRALMKGADLEPGDVDARSAGFRLGPRINAAGRLQRADAALELMLTEDEDRAHAVATELDGLNHDRRETEQRILHAAEAACAGQMSAAALVVAGEDWHPGVVGIVASRLVERFRRPAVVIALEGGSGRGSGRSIAPYDLHAGLSAASDHLLGYGGHRMAAGLQIEAAHVEGFRRALAAHAGAQLAPGDLVPVERVDDVIPGGALTLETAEELERLGPFGAGNPAPTLLVPAARIEHVTAMGEERKHARFSLVGGGARARGVAFRRSQRSLAAAGAKPHDVAVSLERNRWNGAVEA